MKQRYLSILIALILLLVAVTPVSAVTGGQEDGNMHPYGALLLMLATLSAQAP